MKDMMCPTWVGVVVLLIGLLMLGQDLAWWSFWKIGAWTAVFVLIGLCVVFGKKK